MIATYLNNLDEISLMGDQIIVRLKGYSLEGKGVFSIEDIKKIKTLTDKKIILKLDRLYDESEIKEVEKNIKDILFVDSVLAEDLGIKTLLDKYSYQGEFIYAPETFINNSLDYSLFEPYINSFLISREIKKTELDSILSKPHTCNYYIYGLAHHRMFYSKRPNISLYLEHYNIDKTYKNNYLMTMKEETRNEYYKVIEDDYSFRVYKELVFFPAYFIDKDKINIILERDFISDSMYFDCLNAYKDKTLLSDFVNKYKKYIDNSILFRELHLKRSEEN